MAVEEEGDWYDWLAKNEEIKWGRVRVPGVLPAHAHSHTAEGELGEGWGMSEASQRSKEFTAGRASRGHRVGPSNNTSGYPEVVRRMQEEGGASRRWVASPPRRRGRAAAGGRSFSDGEDGGEERLVGSRRGGKGSHVAYLMHRELRDMEIRLAAQLGGQQARADELLREELFRGALGGLLANTDALIDGFNGVRAAQKDLRDTLAEVEESLARELARSCVDRVDC